MLYIVIIIPNRYSNTFTLLGESTELLLEEAIVIDMLNEEQQEQFNTFMTGLKTWSCQMLETAFMEGAKSGVEACRKADENDNQIVFKFNND